MEYISVKNWSEFQHYKDREPPWIKLHNRLLRDYEFSCLHDASKLLLIEIWLLASQKTNQIPNDPDWIKKQLPFDGEIDLKPLIDGGFLVVEQTASDTLAKCSPETEAETEAEADTQPCPYQRIAGLWNEKMKPEGFPGVQTKTAGRGQLAKLLKARWGEDEIYQTLEWWGRLFDVVLLTDRWNGNNEFNGKPFFATLRWVAGPENFYKVLEEWENLA